MKGTALSVEIIRRHLGELSAFVENIERKRDDWHIWPKDCIKGRRMEFFLISSIIGELGGSSEMEGGKYGWTIPDPVIKSDVSERTLVHEKRIDESIENHNKAADPNSTSIPKGRVIVPIDRLTVFPFRARLDVDDDLDRLVRSIEQKGILNDIIARPIDNGWFEIIAGDRRFHAARRAGFREVEIKVRKVSDLDAFKIMWEENENRKGLSAYERARQLREMMRQFPQRYPSQEALALELGISRQRTQQIMNVLLLEKAGATPVALSKLTEFQLREILKAPKEEQAMIVTIAVENTLSANELRTLISKSRDKRVQLIKDLKLRGRDALIQRTEEIPKKPEINGESEDACQAVCQVCRKTLVVAHHPNGNHSLRK